MAFRKGKDYTHLAELTFKGEISMTQDSMESHVNEAKNICICKTTSEIDI